MQNHTYFYAEANTQPNSCYAECVVICRACSPLSAWFVTVNCHQLPYHSSSESLWSKVTFQEDNKNITLVQVTRAKRTMEEKKRK